jgi:hypothetical protein
VLGVQSAAPSVLVMASEMEESKGLVMARESV